MKNIMLVAASVAGMLVASVVQAEDLTGRWLTATQDAYVEISKAGDIYTGRIVGSPPGANPDRENKDVNNQDESLRDRPLLGLAILTGLKKKEDNLWKGGTIYDPNKGASYDCRVWLEDGVLMLRGYKGFFHRTSEWTRARPVESL